MQKRGTHLTPETSYEHTCMNSKHKLTLVRSMPCMNAVMLSTKNKEKMPVPWAVQNIRCWS